jgi:conjugative transfer region protein TrbK
MRAPIQLSGQTWARITAGALVILAVLVTAARLQPGRGPGTGANPRAAAAVDPLQADLFRCQALGQAGASDPRCLAAWAESRRRFLAGAPRT